MERRLVIDQRQDAYGTFFTDDFGRRAFAASDLSPIISEPIFDLVADWRSASYVGALPASIPGSIKNFHDGFIKTESSVTDILGFADVIMIKLSRELPELIDNQQLRRELHQKIVAISSEVMEAKASANQELDGNFVWEQYLALFPFKLGLHGTMRLVYLAVYSAYENFVVRCLSIAHGGKPIRVTNRDFDAQLKHAFGELANDAWFAPDIHIARLVRHSFMHAGGRITKELRNRKIPLEAQDGCLHVYPEHISKLYNVLKVPAFAIMEAEIFRNDPRAG
jgi:hypothetical protein